jgi:DNA polymerase bacteriophage-type
LTSGLLNPQETFLNMPVIHLHLDFETRSRLDIRTVGLDRYARAAEVLMLAWAVGEQPPQIWLPSEGSMPDKLRCLLTTAHPGIVKIAWNAAFERAILQHCFNFYSDPGEWIDPCVIARYAGLPGKLALVSQFLQLGDKGKDKEGSRLIAKFSKLHKSKKIGEHFKDWHDPKHAADWIKFQEYCKRDVIAEREIFTRLKDFFWLPAQEQKLWELDAKINERGMPVSMDFVRNADRIVRAELGALQKELNELTGLQNANSVQQLLPWLQARGYPSNSLGKEKIVKALETR